MDHTSLQARPSTHPVCHNNTHAQGNNLIMARPPCVPNTRWQPTPGTARWRSSPSKPPRCTDGFQPSTHRQARLMLLMGERAEHVPDTMGTATPLAFGNLMPPDDLRHLRDYADVIGPSNKDIIPRDADGAWSTPTSLIDDAHRAGYWYIPTPSAPKTASCLRNCAMPRGQCRKPAGINRRNPTRSGHGS